MIAKDNYSNGDGVVGCKRKRSRKKIDEISDMEIGENLRRSKRLFLKQFKEDQNSCLKGNMIYYKLSRRFCEKNDANRRKPKVCEIFNLIIFSRIAILLII
jgi:hypothetical protein